MDKYLLGNTMSIVDESYPVAWCMANVAEVLAVVFE